MLITLLYVSFLALGFDAIYEYQDAKYPTPSACLRVKDMNAKISEIEKREPQTAEAKIAQLKIGNAEYIKDCARHKKTD